MRIAVPTFESTVEIRCRQADLFEYLARPANLIRISPPQLNLTVVEAPERLTLGSRLTVRGRRSGVSQTMITEVTAFEPVTLLAETLHSGPFRRFTHARRLVGNDDLVRLTDYVDFEPPGGFLGLVMTRSVIEKYFADLFTYRGLRLREELEPPA
jgi:ligand-binding SRPBCC domain-containing protein